MSTIHRFPPSDWQALAANVAEDGFERHQPTVVEFATAARSAGLSNVLIDVVSDPAEPEVARLRAFGRLAVALAAGAGDGRRRRVRPAA